MDPPLLTYDLYDAFLEAGAAADESDVVSKICACVMKLPPLNHDVLSEVLSLLIAVLEHEDKNRMGIDNLATIFAPCLISKDRSKVDPTNLTDETQAIMYLIKHAATVVKIGRVGATPRDLGLNSTAFPGVRVLSQPHFSSSPVIGRRKATNSTPASPALGKKASSKKGPALAYVKYDYKGSPAAGTLTVARGDSVFILETPENNHRWCLCKSNDGEEGLVPISFLDCPSIPRVALGREKALSRAGGSSAPLSMSMPKISKGELPRIKTLEEMSDRIDILTRALVKEKEDRIALEKRVAALMAEEK